ncbi:GTPase, G3E family [Nocardioides scoriae]|uniref:GTPase, G3E family n=1 Tax=Nocardioides scoriae TaxID=642780 RepID=A0A1H1XMU3_9ACTN|nr:GTP-binding protein [Nocardioides scoriae]SDT10575.1 GTPase, G3E family [Nocardioides scoriae]
MPSLPDRRPVTLLSGVSPESLAATMVSLLWDRPRSVAVQHHLDVDAQRLTRTVSDAQSVVERVEVDLEHACVSCAVTEDVVPTLVRLAASGRWDCVIAHLPVGAPAAAVCHLLETDADAARVVRVASVLACVEGSAVVDDLLGDDLLRERGLASSADDSRGVGEVACAQVEHADHVVVTGPVQDGGADLLAALRRPGVPVVLGPERLPGDLLVRHDHHHAATLGWVDLHRDVVAPHGSGRAWTRDLVSDRAFHPERLLLHLDRLGGGRHRSRGWFWLPTRPGRRLAWDGSGGQLSVGDHGTWGRGGPRTRLLLTGVGTPPDHLEQAFEDLLVGPADSAGTTPWAGRSGDGFEPWLGPVRRVA